MKNFEDQFVERKVFSDSKDWLKTVVAFANSASVDYPCILYIGVRDTGEVEDQHPNSVERLLNAVKVLPCPRVLAFAEKIITSPARLWLESSLDQRQRLQQTYFPTGLTFDGQGFGTPASYSFFDLLRGYL
jgi:hypothetical protein